MIYSFCVKRSAWWIVSCSRAEKWCIVSGWPFSFCSKGIWLHFHPTIVIISKWTFISSFSWGFNNDALGFSTGPVLNKESIVESTLMDFCHNLPCSPEKLLRTAYGVRNFSSSEMDRLFIKTEMYLKSKAAASASMPNNKNVMVPRSRSSDVLPSSQSQVNIQMMSHTLTIREVNSPDSF